MTRSCARSSRSAHLRLRQATSRSSALRPVEARCDCDPAGSPACDPQAQSDRAGDRRPAHRLRRRLGHDHPLGGRRECVGVDRRRGAHSAPSSTENDYRWFVRCAGRARSRSNRHRSVPACPTRARATRFFFILPSAVVGRCDASKFAQSPGRDHGPPGRTSLRLPPDPRAGRWSAARRRSRARAAPR